MKEIRPKGRRRTVGAVESNYEYQIKKANDSTVGGRADAVGPRTRVKPLKTSFGRDIATETNAAASDGNAGKTPNVWVWTRMRRRSLKPQRKSRSGWRPKNTRHAR